MNGRLVANFFWAARHCPTLVWAVLVCGTLTCGAQLRGAVYEVGPGRPYATIGEAPWESLQPGDIVLIHWRPEPYPEKWVLCRQGTADEPIVVRGVPGPEGELPVIEGNGARTPERLRYWNEVRGILKIGGASFPPDTMPRHLVVEGLEFRGARPPNSFTAANGSLQRYSNNAAAIYVEKGEHVTIRNCILRDSGNGLFIGSVANQPSKDFLITGNFIYGNGNAGSGFEHNNYSAAVGIVFEYNRFGPLRPGAIGNNLKDRSAGLVVRYNWIEGGNRQLDLVDAEGGSLIANDASYRATYVYGNILIEPEGAGNRQIIHYGGDSADPAGYRKGFLYLYHNTIISTRTDRTTLLRLSTNQEASDVRNNIVYVTAPGNTLSLLDTAGTLYLSRNWFKPGQVVSFGSFSGSVHDDGSSVLGTEPGFVGLAEQDFRLLASSEALDQGFPLHPEVPDLHAVTRQYEKHQRGQDRPQEGPADLGAFEFSSPIVHRLRVPAARRLYESVFFRIPPSWRMKHLSVRR
ncbi:MAG: right-handed parallel beta-helix repeat-containing protein [Bryobacteraceae bacterium]|nr:right-handed parallel beta-helix repeat-containing protein [Bryobacteraceae bacterium]MDW8379884.1 right-handed parallel beta-helix repeat-containing protein [Bryobacterales bacterium]